MKISPLFSLENLCVSLITENDKEIGELIGFRFFEYYFCFGFIFNVNLWEFKKYKQKDIGLIFQLGPLFLASKLK